MRKNIQNIKSENTFWKRISEIKNVLWKKNSKTHNLKMHYKKEFSKLNFSLGNLNPEVFKKRRSRSIFLSTLLFHLRSFLSFHKNIFVIFNDRLTAA